MLSSWRRFGVVVLAAVAAAPLITATPAAAAPITVAAQAPLDPAKVRGLLDSLMRTYHISQAEALRRLELQRYDAAMTPKLEATYGSSYAGSWIDQDHGGTLVIGATKPSSITFAISAAPDRSHIRVTAAKHSLRELEAIAADLSRRYAIPAAVAPVIDEVRDTLVLPVPAAQQVARMGGLATSGYGADIVHADQPAATGSSRQLACTLQNCTPPMRGGLKMYLFPAMADRPNWDHFCTNGFNVHGSNNWQYTLTAGHCMGPATGDHFEDNNSQWVGYYNAPTYAGGTYPVDGAILPYVVSGGTNYATYWLNGQPKNRVFYQGVDALFPITGMYTLAQIHVGWSACRTGASSLNTLCGTVQPLQAGDAGGIRMNLIGCQGDSGGPLFSPVDNKGYGIVSEGRGDTFLGANGYTCYYSTVYAALSTIFATAHTSSGLTFTVNTA